VAPVKWLERYLRDEVLDLCAITVTAAYHYEAIQPGVDAGDLTLECAKPDGLLQGYFYLATARGDAPGAGRVWLPASFFGYVVEPGHEAEAQAVLLRLVESLRIASYDAPLAPINGSTSDASAGDAYLQARRELFQQQQTTAMISSMMEMQHLSNMTIINNLGGWDYDYEWTWSYD
jgi:hypothetical protein